MRRIAAIHTWIVVGCLTALFGCDYNSKMAAVYKAYEAGNFNVAATDVSGLAEKAPRRDRVAFRLEEGAILRAAGQQVESNKAFKGAEQLVGEFDSTADVSVSQEAAAIAYNQTAFDYRGYTYDRIMMNTYQALNNMELGDAEGARVELRRAFERQREAVDKYASKIETDNKVRQEKRGDYDVNRAEGDGRFQQQMKGQYAELDVPDLAAYANYVNPFAEYLQGIFLMTAGVDSSDLEQAATAMRRVAGMIPDNPYIAKDLAMAEKLAGGGQLEPTTYVIFETGLAPRRDEIRIDIPLFFVNNKVDYFGCAFPKLEKQGNVLSQITARAGGQQYPTAIVCNMDNVVYQEFKNELPMIITRELISAGVKAGAAYALNEATRKDDLANALTRIGTTLYQIGTNSADLRTWKTLPKYFCIARFPTPSDRQVALELSSGGTLPPITLSDGVINIIFVKSVQPALPPAVRQFKLK